MLIRTIRKSVVLARVSRTLAQEKSAREVIAQMTSSRGTDEHAAALELYRLCESDQELSRVLSSYGCDQNTFADVFQRLVCAGAGVRVRGQHVAAAALASRSTLDYTLANLLRDDCDRRRLRQTATRIVDYFSNRESGPLK